jgi:phosphoglycerate dehydrogenase-like enzyme
MPSILITDDLFHPATGPDQARLRDAGYDIDHLVGETASEETLVEHIKGKVGYILGGIETVTDAVIAAADELRAIAFTGSGYAEFLPGWQLATDRGIAISAARGENATAVAEWTLAAALSQVRNLFALSSPNGTVLFPSRDFDQLTWGIVGFGNVGHAVAEKARALGFVVITSTEDTGGSVPSVSKSDLLQTADIISVHVSKGRGDGALDATAIKSIKAGTVIVNAAFDHAIDNETLLARLKSGEIRAAVDYPLPYEGVPTGALMASKVQSAYNTQDTNERIGKRSTTSLLNLLSTGDDPDLINPEYRQHARSARHA